MESPIESATMQHERIFVIYIAVLVASALLIAFLTWLVWDSGNRVQDAIQVDATARIEEAKREAAKALEGAAEANRVAESERLARLKIEERLGGWTLSPEQAARVTEEIKAFPGTPFDLSANSAEARFMEQLDAALIAAGWTRRDPEAPPSTRPGMRRVLTLMHNKAAINNAVGGVRIAVAKERMSDFQKAAEALTLALADEGIPTDATALSENTNPKAIHISIGKRE